MISSLQSYVNVSIKPLVFVNECLIRDMAQKIAFGESKLIIAVKSYK